MRTYKGSLLDTVTPLPIDGDGKLLPAAKVVENVLDELHIISMPKLTWWFNGRVWEVLPDPALDYLFIHQDPPNRSTIKRRSELKALLKAETLAPPGFQWACGLKEHEIPFYDGVFDARAEKLRPHRPGDMCTHTLPLAYPSNADWPDLWCECLDFWMEGDQSKIDALQEFMGYILIPRARFKKCLFLYGPSNCGKSVITSVMSEMVGPERVCHIEVEDMASDRALTSIWGKMVNIIEELGSSSLLNDAGFKRLVSTEQSITINPKYKDKFEYVPTCKHVVATNALPVINDISDATYNRIILIDMNRVIPEADQDRDIHEKLYKEMPGILLWAVAGCKKLLLQKGHFTGVKTGEEMLLDHREDLDPLAVWLDARVIVGAENATPVKASVLYDNYRRFSGPKHLGVQKFHAHMAKRGLHRIKRRGPQGVTRYYEDIALKTNVVDLYSREWRD